MCALTSNNCLSAGLVQNYTFPTSAETFALARGIRIVASLKSPIAISSKIKPLQWFYFGGPETE
jgi:hypothetical protein